MKAKNAFVALNARNVLGHVGRFGEDIVSKLAAGEVVSDIEESYPFADVVNTTAQLAVQVKMCNGRHAQRPLPQQIDDLFKEIDNGFLFNHGVYAFVFYNGVHHAKGRRGKSRIWSRKFSQVDRREIISHELQYIYILDVRLLQYMAHQTKFIKEKAIVFIPEEKPTRSKVLYLNRTHLAGFRDQKESARKLFDAALGKSKWVVKTKILYPRFKKSKEEVISRELPVHIIGSIETVKAVKKALCTSAEILISQDTTQKAFSI